MVVLERPSLAAVDALSPGEPRNGTQVQRGLEGSGIVTAEMLDGVDAGAIVEDRFQEGVLRQLPGQLDRNRATVDDVAHLARVGVSPAPGVNIADDHQLRGGRSPGPTGSDQLDQGISGVSLETLPRSSARSHLLPQAQGGGFDAADQAQAGLGWQSPGEANHAFAVSPVPEFPGLELPPVKLGRVHPGLAELPGLVAQPAQVRPAGDGKQLRFCPLGLGLGQGDLRRLGQRYLTGSEGGPGIGAPLQATGGVEGLAGL